MAGWLAVLALSWAQGPASIDDLADPRRSGRWVVDRADVLEDLEEQHLDALLTELHRDTDAEVAVVTVRDTVDEPKAFATGLFNHWGLGDARAHNGLLVLLVVDRRRLEMETGYGLEVVVPDGWLGAMQAERMVPLFKDGRYGAGLTAGVEATAARLRSHADAVRAGAPAPPTATGGEAFDPEAWASSTVLLTGGGLGGAGVLGIGGLLWWRRRERTCPTCAIPMDMVPEHEDDAQLTEGQRFEEEIGSVDYQIYVCPSCSFSKTIRVAAWFSGYSSCPACQHRARSSTSTTIRAATTSSGGLVRVHESCAFCHDSRTYTRSTPRIQRSSSGGGGGGGSRSSFGGGRSGGGGAGSSW